jgi:adenine-specific DNA glycosylase
VCTPKKPSCCDCPISSICHAYAEVGRGREEGKRRGRGMRRRERKEEREGGKEGKRGGEEE